MPLQLFLNDLSLPAEECVLDVARARLKHLVGALRASARISRDLIFTSETGLNAINIGSNWPVAELRNAPGCKEESLYLRTVQDRWPHRAAILNLRQAGGGDDEYRMPHDAEERAGDTALGLGLAYETGGLAISIASRPFWQLRLIHVERLTLADDGEIASSFVQAMNASDEASVEHHAEQLRRTARPEVDNGEQLWERREALFPHLRFIPRTRQQIRALLHGDPLFQSAVDRLLRLDLAVADWRASGAPRPAYPFNVRGESDTRMHLVNFRDGAGAVRVFSDHADLAPGANRLHFLLVEEPQRLALIGHVGRKLGIG